MPSAAAQLSYFLPLKLMHCFNLESQQSNRFSFVLFCSWSEISSLRTEVRLHRADASSLEALGTSVAGVARVEPPVRAVWALPQPRSVETRRFRASGLVAVHSGSCSHHHLCLVLEFSITP